MISYRPFWETIREKKISTYTIINKYGISSSTINRIRHNEPLTTTTINDLCECLDCDIEDIIVYEKSVSIL